MRSYVYTAAIFVFFVSVNCATFPAGCTYEDYTNAIGLYSCSFINATFPLTYSDFSNPSPQRLKVYDVSGDFTSPFTGFTSMSVTSTVYKATLEIVCINSASITLSSTSFADVTYIHELRIVNCNITDLPTAVFGNLNLHFLEIEGGYIAQTQSDSLSSLTVSKLSNIPNPIGGISFKNTEIIGGNISSGFFDPLTSVVSITLDNVGLANLETTMFSQNTKLQEINLSRNNFTVIPNIFSGLNALKYVNMSGILWDCTCANLWFTQYLTSNFIDLVGSYMCNTPTEYQYARWTLFYYTVCELTDACLEVPGVVSGITCYEWHKLMMYFVLMIAMLLTVLAFIIFFNVRVKMKQTERNIESKRKRVHTKIKEALIRGKDGQTAPATTSAPRYLKIPPRTWVDPTGAGL